MTTPSNYCADLLKEQDPALYASLLFLPEKHRAAVMVLQAFHLEIGRIAYLVREPLPGEIRLQWWRDVINGDRAGEAASNPLARVLLDVIAQHVLPRDGFIRYLDARLFDLYNDPMPDNETLEAYYGETESFILQMTALICRINQNSQLADACGYGGVATGAARTLHRIAHDRNRQRCFVPVTQLNSAALDLPQWFSTVSASHESVLIAQIRYARDHLDNANAAIRQLPKQAQPVFLPLIIIRQYVRLFEKRGAASVLRGEVREPSPLIMQLALWKAALFGH